MENIESLAGKKILIAGAAGFIGYYLAKRLLSCVAGVQITGIDCITDYYDTTLKDVRLRDLDDMQKQSGSSFKFCKVDIAHKDEVMRIFAEGKFDVVVNLAAQAGVRYSIDNPDSYIQSNIIGFYNLLEAIRNNGLPKFVYASSSSVYGGNTKVPFSEDDKVDLPVSLYAATKKSDELMAHAYCKLYGIECVGLRFFTVYGPIGRPDMAYFKFTNKMVQGEPIQIYNNGDLWRDYTYIDDIIEGVVRVLGGLWDGSAPYRIYNIGNNRCESLMHFIEVLEKSLMDAGVIDGPCKKEFLPMQPGDVYKTYADITKLEHDYGYRPSTTIDEGLAKFAKWYKEYYKP